MAELLNVIRKAIQDSGESRYRISTETGIAQSQLSRVMNGKASLSLETVERLADYLGLEIVVRPKRRQKGK